MPIRHAIDLSRLPAPSVVEELSYEAIVSSMIRDLVALDPAYAALLESDPAIKVLEVAAARELLVRQRINDAAKSVMLAFAKGSDLDNLAALLGVERAVVAEANPIAEPPIAAVLESDERLRERVTMALDGYPTAGSAESYRFHALSAAPSVRDVWVGSPYPGRVAVVVLSSDGNGAPAESTVEAVRAALTDEKVRPLTDRVEVSGATIVSYEIDAILSVYDGPDAEVVRAAAEATVRKYADDAHRLGRGINLSALYAALHREGVRSVTLNSPTADVSAEPTEAAYCTSVKVAIAGGNA